MGFRLLINGLATDEIDNFRLLRKSGNLGGTFCREGRPDISLHFICPQTRPVLQKKLTKSLRAPGISPAVYSWKHAWTGQGQQANMVYMLKCLQWCQNIHRAIKLLWCCASIELNDNTQSNYGIHSLGAFFTLWKMKCFLYIYIRPDSITLLKSIHGKAVKGGSRLWVSTPKLCKRSLPWWWWFRYFDHHWLLVVMV